MTIYKQDFLTYCLDLNKITPSFSFIDLIKNQSEPSFSDIIDQAIASNPTTLDLLKTTDCCIIAHDTYERNPKHAHIGTYLINRYNLSCDIVDVIGDGITPAVNVAKHLIGRYLQCGKIKSGVILVFGSLGMNRTCDQNLAGVSQLNKAIR